ncbi:hypothetical protein R1flu_028460 [Riccia fluitans]|uniref:C2H2-type domain-containing protein n=1 Tax=Riccia fluitans TaxID=41844 RepID=A0ABD1XLR5_9MARC
MSNSSPRPPSDSGYESKLGLMAPTLAGVGQMPRRLSITEQWKPYALVQDSKGRRRIICTVSTECVEVFSEIPAFNIHLAAAHNCSPVIDFDVFSDWRKLVSGPPKRAPKGSGAQDMFGNCIDFIRLRGTLCARWKINRRRKYKLLLQKAIEFIGGNDSDSTDLPSDDLLAKVHKTYRQWKKREKVHVLNRLSTNLKTTLMTQYRLTEKDAIVQGGLEEDIVDSSDDEYE